MILQIGLLILLCVIAYTIYICIPEIKVWLQKNNINTYNTNISIPEIKTIGANVSQERYELSDKNKDEKELLENLDDKMSDLFVNPDFKNIKTNFQDLGNIKVEK